MGAIAQLLLLPVMAPVWGFRFVLERLRDEADAVLQDEGRAYAELLQLSMRHNAGELSDAEYAEQEADLLERLDAMREYQNELMDAQWDEDDAGEDEDWITEEPDLDEEEWVSDETEEDR
jgi:gas vesicle protein GvpG